MKRVHLAVIVIFSVFVLGSVPDLEAEPRIHFPTLPEKLHTSKETLQELYDFYSEMEEALAEKDLKTLMVFYDENYQHRGINKMSIKFMWLEIFSEYDNLYSIHAFTKVLADDDAAILICTGALFGVKKSSKTGDFETVDRWIKQPHWLANVGGIWKVIGGGVHNPAKEELLKEHPLF